MALNYYDELDERRRRERVGGGGLGGAYDRHRDAYTTHRDAYTTHRDAYGQTNVLADPKWLRANIIARTNNGRRAPDAQAQEWINRLNAIESGDGGGGGRGGGRISTRSALPRIVRSLPRTDFTGNYLQPTGGPIVLGPAGGPSAVGFNRPADLKGGGLTPAELSALNPNYNRPVSYGSSPIIPAPARQAVDAAVAGNASLGNPENRTVVSDDGYQTTYFGNGGYARSRIPSGTNIQRTENGHTVLSFPNGLQRIVGATGNVVNYKPSALPDTVKDFSNPVLNSEQAANYLNTSKNLSTTFATPNPEAYGSSTERATPNVPLVTRPADAPTAPTAAAPQQNITGAFGVPNLGAAASNVRTGVSNYLQRAQQSFVPYTQRKDDKNQY